MARNEQSIPSSFSFILLSLSSTASTAVAAVGPMRCAGESVSRWHHWPISPTSSFAVVVLLQASLAALPSDHLMPILPIPSLSNQISCIGLLIHMQPRSCRCRSLSVLFGLPLPRLHSMNPWYTIAISAYRFKLRTPSAQVYDVFHPLAEAARRSLVFLRTSGKLHQREPICGAHMHPYLPTVAFMVLISH